MIGRGRPSYSNKLRDIPVTRIFTDDQLRHKDLATLKHYLCNKLGGYRVAIIEIRTDELLYRGVRCQVQPTMIDDVSYPPAKMATRCGRVNRTGCSVFYSSLAGPAVFYELRAKQGDLIALSEWEVAEPLWMHHLGYHEHALQRKGVVDLTNRSRLLNPIPNESRENAKLRRRWSLAFTEDIPDGQEYRYKQSIAINEWLFDGASPLPVHADGPRHPCASGTVYPAMPMRGAADNVAIWPEFVRSSLRIKSVRYVRVVAADEATSSYTLLTLAYSQIFSGRQIVWQDVDLPERQRLSHIALEGNQWILRDGFNQVYNRH